MADGVIVVNCGSAAGTPVQTDTDNAAAVVAAAAAANAAADQAALETFVAAVDPNANTSDLSAVDQQEVSDANPGTGGD